ncbi:MAG: SRPBCC domain-containing protein [Myxococcota bacterium]
MTTKPKKVMKNYSVAFTVAPSPDAVFSAVNNVRGWWSEDIEGRTDRLGAKFTFRHRDLHESTQEIVELVPGKRVVWRVSDSHIRFVKEETEWDDTQITFEITETAAGTELWFTHVGLVPAMECYADCSDAWGFLILQSLRNLITTGTGQPLSNAA